MKIALCGYYGFGNFGDELMLLGILKALNSCDGIDEVALSCRQDVYGTPEYSKFRFRLRRIPLGRFSRVRTLHAMATSDVVMWGGGTCLFEPSTGNPGLKELLRMIRLVNTLQSRFVFLGIGIGDFATPEGKEIARQCLFRAHRLYLRDEASYRMAIELTGQPGKCVLSFDPAFASELGRVGAPKPSVPQKKRMVTFSGVYGQSADAADFYATQLDELSLRMYTSIHFMAAHQGCRDDHEFHRAIADRMNFKEVSFQSWESPNEFMGILAQADLHIGMRLHSVIAADLLSVPSLAIEYASKIRAYMLERWPEEPQRLLQIGQPFPFSEIPGLITRPKGGDQFFRDRSSLLRRHIEDALMP